MNQLETNLKARDFYDCMIRVLSIGIKNTCEEILAEYLIEMGHKVNDKFFMTVIAFIRLYKDCMDEYGWSILIKYKPDIEQKAIFTKREDAEHIPEACNLLMNKFFIKEFPNLDSAITSDLIMHLCDWLYMKGYTHTKIIQL